MPWSPSGKDIDFYRENGFLIARDVFDEKQLAAFDKAILKFAKLPTCQSSDRKARYPEPSKYTISHEGLVDPDLASIANDPSIIDTVEILLGQQPCLKAFVAYLRTPGDRGTVGDYQGSSQTGHCDYKPFRPAGSSLNWLFTILALADYTEEIGPLYLSPSSHKCTRLEQRGRITHVHRARADEIPPMVDSKLRRGDLVFMHMFCWHEAPGNRSNQDRWGIYNKYMGVDAPPGCGPFVFSDDAYNALNDRGRQTIRHHSHRSIGTARLIVEHQDRILMVRMKDPRNGQGAGWMLPGGVAEQRDVITDWDIGNVIASLEANVQDQTGLEIDWMTYVGDYVEGNELCRVYSRPLEDLPPLPHSVEHEFCWFNEDELKVQPPSLANCFVLDAVRSWLHEPKLRGIGQSQMRAGLKVK